jgi:hypothetical protein
MDEKKWIAYQSLWDTTKIEDESLGSRGQGKFLFHYFSSNKLVLTESIDRDRKYRFSFGTSEEYEDEDKNLKEFFPSANTLDHQGTRIMICNVEKDFLRELLDVTQFMKYIAATWWEIINNWNAIFVVDFDGVERVVIVPDMPKTEKEIHLQNIKIKDMGMIRNLVIRFCHDDVPEEFRGVAIQRGGMTILRIPIQAEESTKNKIYGYCNFDDTMVSELKKIELPNHFGFSNKRAWNYVREFVKKKTDEFLQTIRPTKEKEIKISSNIIERAVNFVNTLVSMYAPEVTGDVIARGGKKERLTLPLEITGGVEDPPEGPPPPPPPPGPPSLPAPIRISSFLGNQRKVEYDENLVVKTAVMNETDDDVKLQLSIFIKHEDGTMKMKKTFNNVEAHNKSITKLDPLIVDFYEKKDKSGEYKAIATLKHLEENKHLHKRTFTFFLHEEPPKKGRAFLSTMKFIRAKGTSVEKKKQFPVNDKGVLTIIADHPDFIHIRDLAGKRKDKRNTEVLLYIIKCGIDGAIQKLLEFRFNEGDLDAEEMNTIKVMSDEMYYEANISGL